jgi:hypothetical protein
VYEFLLGFLLTLAPVFVDSVPDFEKPYAPIFTDKPVYSWTDKIIISISAPSWNSNSNQINSIGESNSHPIKISSGENFLKPYRFTETSSNSGIFSGEIILTGFLHDVDGDGLFDTQPKTTGNGPTNGLLEVKNGDSITISFEFADGVVLTESIPIRWNMGVIEFSQDIFLADDSIEIRVIDPDMNLNPESIDTITIEVFSDSDNAGIEVVATETSKCSGDFITNISLSTNTSSGNQLHVIPGDNIFAKYDDYTLPKPFSKSDEKSIETFATVDYSIPSINRIQTSPLYFSDSFGNSLDSLVSKSQIQVVGKIENQLNYDQEFIYFLQIKNSDNSVISLSWIKGKLSPNQILDISQFWIPENSQNYILETYVWNSLSELIPLSPSQLTSVIVD